MRLATLGRIKEDSRQDEDLEDQISECSYSNRVHELLQSKDWSKLARVLATTQGIEMVSEEIPFSGGDYPLHLLCDFTTDVKNRQEIIEAQMELQRRQVEKFKAWEERQRRRIRGDDVATVYDSDEWTSSDESEGEETTITTNTDKYSSKSSISLTMPPASVVCAMLQAYPLAARKKGFAGRLPLHHVVRHNFPLEVVEAVLKAYPEGRTFKDKKDQSPHDLMEADNEALEIQAILDRPTPCWVHAVEEEKSNRTLSQDLVELEQDIEKLKRELDETKEEEERLYETVQTFYVSCIDVEKRRNQDQDNFERLCRIEDMVESETNQMMERLNELEVERETIFKKEQVERNLSKAFADDVKKLVGDAEGDLSQLHDRYLKVKS